MTVIMIINESVTDFRYPVKQERTDCQYSYSSSYSDGTPECSTPDSLDMDLSGPGKLIYVIIIYILLLGDTYFILLKVFHQYAKFKITGT